MIVGSISIMPRSEILKKNANLLVVNFFYVKINALTVYTVTLY